MAIFSAAHHMTHAGIVAALKALAVLVTKIFRNIRVTIFIAVINIRLTMVLVIFASPYHAILKPTPLRVVVLRRYVIPSPVLTISWWR